LCLFIFFDVTLDEHFQSDKNIFSNNRLLIDVRTQQIAKGITVVWVWFELLFTSFNNLAFDFMVVFQILFPALVGAIAGEFALWAFYN
jgi:hypothetical protein